MGLISKFLAAKSSTVILLIGCLALVGYIYWEGKQSGEAQSEVARLESVRKDQAKVISALQSEISKKQATITKQNQVVTNVKRILNGARQQINQARKQAAEDLKRCLDMRVADGMQFGPSRENQDSEDQARSNMDG